MARTSRSSTLGRRERAGPPGGRAVPPVAPATRGRAAIERLLRLMLLSMKGRIGAPVVAIDTGERRRPQRACLLDLGPIGANNVRLDIAVRHRYVRGQTPGTVS